MKLFTIGFTKSTAERFFTRLQQAGVQRIVDVRLHNVSQLAGFAKKDDLRYFAKELCGIDYAHRPDLAPTEELLDRYKQHGDWSTYEAAFLDLARTRAIEKTVPKDLLDGGCLLCSEDQPHYCHRRLVAEYLHDQWGDVEIVHL